MCFGLRYPSTIANALHREVRALGVGTGLGLKLLSHHLRTRASHHLQKNCRAGRARRCPAGHTPSDTIKSSTWQNGLRRCLFGLAFILYSISREGRRLTLGHVIEAGCPKRRRGPAMGPAGASCSMRTLCKRAMHTVGYGLTCHSARETSHARTRLMKWARTSPRSPKRVLLPSSLQPRTRLYSLMHEAFATEQLEGPGLESPSQHRVLCTKLGI